MWEKWRKRLNVPGGGSAAARFPGSVVVELLCQRVAQALTPLVVGAFADVAVGAHLSTQSMQSSINHGKSTWTLDEHLERSISSLLTWLALTVAASLHPCYPQIEFGPRVCPLIVSLISMRQRKRANVSGKFRKTPLQIWRIRRTKVIIYLTCLQYSFKVHHSYKEIVNRTKIV